MFVLNGSSGHPIMDVTVIMLDGTSLSLRVNPHDTVGSLKVMIQSRLGVPPTRQQLVVVSGDQKRTLDVDSSSVSSFGLRSGSRISLLLKEPPTTQVFLKNLSGKLSTYDVKPDESVKEMKQKVQAREGLQASQQRLLFQSREMMDQNNLSDYGVKDHSTIDLMTRLRGG